MEDLFETGTVTAPDPKQTRRAASLCAFAAVFAIVLTYTILFGITLLLNRAKLSDRAYDNLIMIVNTVVIDGVALPLAWLLLLRRTPIVEPPEAGSVRSPLSFRVFFFYFPCAFVLMYGGALLGRLIGMLFGKELSDVVDSAIGSVDVWVTVLCAGIAAPIAEELFFRKAMIDRLSGHHPTDAILYSALLFALIHGNLTQFLYAFPLGVLFGFVYYRTRNVGHTILLHVGINLLGGVVPQLVSMIDSEGEGFSSLASTLVMVLYSGVTIVLCVFGIIHLVRYRKQYFPIRTALPRFRRPFYLNAGFIVACVIFTGLFVLNEIVA